MKGTHPTQLMKKARASASFNSFGLTCLLHGGCVFARTCSWALLTNSREGIVRQRRAAFERVEKIIGTRDTAKLPRCYANHSREELYNEGLQWGKAAFQDGLRYKHILFESVTPQYILANSKCVVYRWSLLGAAQFALNLSID